MKFFVLLISLPTMLHVNFATPRGSGAAALDIHMLVSINFVSAAAFCELKMRLVILEPRAMSTEKVGRRWKLNFVSVEIMFQANFSKPSERNFV